MANNWKIHMRIKEGGQVLCRQRLQVNLAHTNNPEMVTCERCREILRRAADRVVKLVDGAVSEALKPLRGA